MIQEILGSLQSGEKIYEYSQLKECLINAGVDIPDTLNLCCSNDKQALLCIAEKYVYDVSRARQENEVIEVNYLLLGSRLIPLSERGSGRYFEFNSLGFS